MLSLFLIDPLAFLIIFPGLLLAITVHEFAHAWMADRLGDPTPRYQGRVTLDPRAHLDPLGTLAMLMTRFGWGRPVQFDPYNLQNPLKDTALIALAGPVSNLIIAAIIAGIFRLGILPSAWWIDQLGIVMLLNINLAIFNLVPVYPLDGSKIITALLPKSTAIEYELFMQRYGLIVLLLLLLPWNGVSPISQLTWPVIKTIVGLLV